MFAFANGFVGKRIFGRIFVSLRHSFCRGAVFVAVSNAAFDKNRKQTFGRTKQVDVAKNGGGK